MKKLSVSLIAIFLALGLVMARPFVISANTSLSAPFIGVNITYYDVENKPTALGFAGHSLTPTSSSQTFTCQSYSSSGACSIYKSNDSIGYVFDSNISVSSQNIIYYSYEFVLDDYYVGYVSVNNTSYFVNGVSFSFVDNSLISSFTISNVNLVRQQSGQWSWPNESASFVFEMLYWDADLYSLFGYYDFDIPMFQAQSGDKLFRIYLPKDIDYDIILIFNRSGTASNLFNYLVPEDATDLEIVSYEPINSDFILASSDYAYRYAHYVIKNTGSSRSVIFSAGVNNLRIVPIYLSRADIRNISTEFAQRNGISNQLLDDVHQIAQGTNQSNNEASDLVDESDDFSTSSSALFTQENNFNNSMNTNLNNINTNVDIGNFGQVFLGSANWVRTQFDNLTYSTPYGSILGYSLLLGLGLLIIGKVVK